MSGWLHEDDPPEAPRRYLTEKLRRDPPDPTGTKPMKWFIIVLAGAILTWLALVAIVVLVAWFSPAFGRDLAVGDSIALGTGEALNVETRAVSGAGSCAIIGYVPAGYFDHVVVSAGINDGGACVTRVREKLDAGVVVWILPANINHGYAAVRAVARAYGDRTVRYLCRGGCTKTNFHPASYAAVARWVRTKWNDGRLPPAIFAEPPASRGR